MKLFKYLTPIALAIIGFVFYHCLQQKKDPSTLFFDKHHQATDSVVKLLGLTGIRIQNDSLTPDKDWPESKVTLKSRSLEEITDAVQGKISPLVIWKRSNNKERWEANLPFSLSENQMVKIKEIISNNLNLKEETKPALKTYQGVLFLGSTLSSVRKRLSYLNKLIDSKTIITPAQVYVLSGERKLDKAIGEDKEALLNPNNGSISFNSDWKGPVPFPNNETDMIKIVFDQSKHPALKDENIIFVHTLKNKGEIRATTETTIYKWLDSCKPAAGLYLAISNQPYVFYQALSIQKSLLKAGRQDIHVEVVGPGKTPGTIPDKTPELEITVLLDNLARMFYEMAEIRRLSVQIKS
ncbi:MAG: hypothetical protein K2W94_00830 [Alphaproteobacteria bacterium]|nr:hypothetical protein [Alphaproteobacteria bacterium]